MPIYGMLGETSYLPVFGEGKRPVGNVRGNASGGICPGEMFYTQYTNVTDGRTDRHRATAKTTLTHSVAR